eukprot:PITA_30100
MDVKSAFLHGDLHEEIYMEQPPGFIQPDSNLVCRLKKSLYGLKQAPWACYAKMDNLLLDIGLSRCHSDNSVYTKKVGKSLIILKKVGYIFTLGYGLITWACKKQSIISISSLESEYHGVLEASKEALCLRQILLEFGFQQQHPTTLWCDNQSAIQLCKDPVQHQRRKHIELHMHFIRKLIHGHVLEVQYCSTDDQVANIFTNALTEVRFTNFNLWLEFRRLSLRGDML